MQISFHTRAKAMEICFGSVYKEEANIAASILRSLLKLNVEVRILICQNIVLSGGSCMVPGFKLRLRQEMIHLIENKKEFELLEAIKDHIEIPENQFPPNCLTWVGASLVASLNTEIDRFFVSPEDFSKNGDKMPDRYGEAYLFAMRDEPYLNSDFEFKNQYAK
jgi:actin-related protein 10